MKDKTQPPSTASATEYEVDIIRCVACKSEVPAGASLCSHCKSYQRVWKNHLQYIAGVATLIALFITACGWIYFNMVKPFFDRDNVQVLSANSLHSAVVVNRGGTEVFVSHMLLYMEGRSSNWQAKRLDFEEILPPGKFLRRGFPSSAITGSAEFVRNLNAADFEKLLVKASNVDPCLELVFFDVQNNFFRDLQKMTGPALNTFDVSGYLEYRGLRAAESTTVLIAGIGVLRRDSRQSCQ